MSFFEGIALRFYSTFILDNRWKYFVDGLWMTLLLTFSSFILGSLIGILICILKLNKYKAVRKTISVLNSFVIQLPTLVLLFIFVYFIFLDVPISVIFLIIFGFTLKTGAYMADIFQSAVDAVNKEEVEAARTLGMTKWQAFRFVTLPQAVKHALPVYSNQFIITLQETSVVGMFAVKDLTRAAELVMSRTLDAFFGMVSISIMYILIGFIATSILNLFTHRKHLGGAVE